MSKEISDIYKMSKDYKKLYDLVLAGYRIPCIVDYRMSMHYRDYAKVFKFEGCDTIIISSRGIEYGGWDNGHNHSFADLCEFLNLEWFLPEEGDKVIEELKIRERLLEGSAKELIRAHEENMKRITKYYKQFEWIEQNHPDIYKQIPR